MLLSAWAEITQQWLIRKRAFHIIARSTLIHSLITNVAKVIFGLFSPVATMLIALTLAGQAVLVTILALGARSNTSSNPPHRALTAQSLKKIIHRHRDFPLYRAPQNFINVVSQGLPIMLLAILFGPASAGYYSIAALAMGMPSQLVGKAVSDVFYPKAVEIHRRGESLALFVFKTTAGLLMLAVIPATMVVASGPEIFSLIFGEEWSDAGMYARWLALFFLFNLINKPAVAVVPVLKLQRGLLFYEIFSTASKCAGLLYGFYILKDDVWAVALFSVIGVIAYLIMMAWIGMHTWRASQ